MCQNILFEGRAEFNVQRFLSRGTKRLNSQPVTA